MSTIHDTEDSIKSQDLWSVSPGCVSAAGSRIPDPKPVLKAQNIASAFSIGGIRGEKKHEKQFLFSIFPDGVMCFMPSNLLSRKPPDVERGKIKGFSAAAAARMRDFILASDVVGSVRFSGSFTIPGVISPDDYYASIMRFRQALLYRGLAGVWRVELQKRKVPHLHCIFYVPLSDEKSFEKVIKNLWLKSIRTSHKYAKKYAVKVKKFDSTASRWMLYISLHNSKMNQLGWHGKQWGIWNRSKFIGVVPDSYFVNRDEKNQLIRILDRWHKKRGGKKKIRKNCNFTRIGLSAIDSKRLVWCVKGCPEGFLSGR